MSFLQSLSDKQVLSRITDLVHRERSMTRGVLLHLNEIERRRLHLKLGYASMFDYCTTGLGYSSSAAARRIRTARCIARYPKVLALLKSNDVNLSTVSQVSRLLTPENSTSLLERIRGKSQREVDAIIAELEPRSMPRERVIPIVVKLPPHAASANGIVGAPHASGELLSPAAAPALPNRKCTASHDLEADHCRSGSELSTNVSTEKRMMLSFSASEEFMGKLDKIKSLAWHRLPANPTLEQLFELAMDYFIKDEDPAARQEKREARKERSNKTKAEVQHDSHKPRPRHIAAAVKDDVFTRDEGGCAYVGINGHRCNSKRALQIDHVRPVARGGSAEAENLRVLCAYHNQLEAERILGARGRFQGAQRAPTSSPKQSRSRLKNDDSSR